MRNRAKGDVYFEIQRISHRDFIAIVGILRSQCNKPIAQFPAYFYLQRKLQPSVKKPSESRDILIPGRQTDGRQDSVAEMAALVALGSAGSSMYRINAAHLMLDASPTKFGMRRVPITDQWTEPDLDVFPLENPPPATTT